ncbi:MAG TPA: hypothetical protein VE954_34930 [Oligoflexus sp.]|uniref:hypothetical protein n=1 Tax=Oligoflexus sp. TaxID=1971216 RepID=UPI002D45387C|nr:hypothetical protein [Oligoflexus sp.]HYX38326.1 hypothetical protein [Oligoflexus sp.]
MMEPDKQGEKLKKLEIAYEATAREFLETAPLYKRIAINLLQQTVARCFPSGISKNCYQCKEIRTFSLKGYRHFFRERLDVTTKIVDALGPVGYYFECGICTTQLVFTILFDSEDIEKIAAKRPLATKIGQFPKDSILPPKSIRDNLNTSGQRLWSQGLICEKNGLGIGAFAYYRQIVEDEIDRLLDKIVAVVPEGDRETFKEKVSEAHRANRASEKIDIVKDFLPSSLRPGSYNPFASIYGALSGGIHSGGTDEVCLGLAATVRDSLEYIIDQVRQQTDLADKFVKHSHILLGNSKKDK